MAAALALPAVSILWLDWGSQFSPATGVATACEFLWVNIIAVALLALDGYFLLNLQSKAEGLLDLEVRWRPSDSLRFGPIESLTIYFW